MVTVMPTVPKAVAKPVSVVAVMPKAKSHEWQVAPIAMMVPAVAAMTTMVATVSVSCQAN